MNIERLNMLISIMERAKRHQSLYMPDFQSVESGLGYAAEESEFHACGNKGCLAGHLAISPEFINTPEEGGFTFGPFNGRPLLFRNGSPLEDKGAQACVTTWLGVADTDLVDLMIFANGVSVRGGLAREKVHALYGVSWNWVTADDVLHVLTGFRDIGVAATLKRSKTQLVNMGHPRSEYLDVVFDNIIKIYEPIDRKRLIEGLDPNDPNLTDVQKALIAEEAKVNPDYFFKVAAKPAQQ